MLWDRRVKKTYEITVTQMDWDIATIRAGGANRTEECVVAQALNRVTGMRWRVGPEAAEDDNLRSVSLPPEARKMVLAFDFCPDTFPGETTFRIDV